MNAPHPADGAPADLFDRLAGVIESRLPARGGDPDASYVARLLARGPEAFLKKIGEEATEVVMAAKDAEHAGPGPRAARAAPARGVADSADTGGDAARQKVVAEMADLWFHCMVALAHFGLSPRDVAAELARREGLSGLDEKSLRKARAREAGGR